ncbi:MAG TPA: NAD(P)/FAD-dependent oxidoreductase, partial [Ktedonobacterales bacterium]|nr:NAD(P)/FAD-dependent oxidoreductase [Ktedonobacterales bacterium]
AGFGGLMTARILADRLPPASGTSILLVDDDNSMLFTPLLWTVAEGRAESDDVVVPIRDFQRHRDYHVLKAAVLRIDLERHVVFTTAGERPYDTLVIATGSITAVPNLPGVRENAHIFHSPADAIELRNRLIDAVEAAHTADDPQERREWLTFVVSGGGDTGVELAAVISTYLHSGLFKEYPWLAQEDVRIVLVGRAARLMPMSDAHTSEMVRRVLHGEGIEVRTGISVVGMSPHAVQTSDVEIPSRTVFWAAGISAPPPIYDLPERHAHNGALVVDDHLRLPEHPEVYVVGDCAWAFDAVTHAAVPPTAQASEHMGAYVARCIAANFDGQQAPAFRYAPRGHLALLGRRTGVARIGPLIFIGLPAWLIWHGYYLSHIPSWRNRARLILDWTLSAIAGSEPSELRLGRDEPVPTAQAAQQAPDSEVSERPSLTDVGR